MRFARLASAVAVTALIFIADAQAVAIPRQTVTVRATTTTPGAPWGVSVDAVYGDGGPEGRGAYALAHVADGLPPGTQVHPERVIACRASQAQLLLLGAAACPGSAVGAGHVRLRLSPGVVVPIDVTLLSAPGAVLFLGREPRTGIGLVEVGRIRNATIFVDLPPIPGVGRGGAATIEREDFHFDLSTGFLTAPSTCPTHGSWTFTRRHTYVDGDTETVTASLPCAARPARHRKPHRRARPHSSAMRTMTA